MKFSIILATVTLSMFCVVHAEEKKYVHRVVDLDNKEFGIRSKIAKIHLDEKINYIGATDEKGYYNEKIDCDNGESIKIEPVSKLYYNKNFSCPVINKDFEISKIEYVDNLIKNAQKFESEGRYDVAAFINNEISFRMKDIDQHKAIAAEKKTYFLTAKSFGIHNGFNFDPKQKKYVASNELIRAVKEYQEKNGIRVTGRLDYPTFNHITGEDIGIYISQNVGKNTD